MRKILILALVLALAVPAVAQIPVEAIPDHYRQGKHIVIYAALDTVHFEDTNPLLEAGGAAFWQGPEDVYVPNGQFLDKKTAYVVGAIIYSQNPFAYKPTWRNGDVNLAACKVDTVGGPVVRDGGAIDSFGYPCYTVVKGDLDEIYIDPPAASAADDSVFVIPLLDYK